MLIAWRGAADAAPAVSPGRRLQTMSRADGIDSIVVHDEFTAADAAAGLAAGPTVLADVRTAEEVGIQRLTAAGAVAAAAG